MSATFSNIFKDFLLDHLTGKQTTILTGWLSRVQCFQGTYPDVSTPLTAVLSGFAAAFTSPIGATAPLNMSLACTGSGTLGFAIIYADDGTTELAHGTITTPGGGGMLIVGSTVVTSGVNFTITGTLKMPLNIGGTLCINAALANDICKDIIHLAPTLLVFDYVNANNSVYDGTVPANADAALGVSNHLLQLNYLIQVSRWSSASGGSSSCAAGYGGTGVSAASGTGSFFRSTRGLDVVQGTVGTSGADMILASTTFTAGAYPPVITGFQLILP